jgi:hypothetical protein
MDDDIKRGAKVGSTIAFWLVFLLSFPLSLKYFTVYPHYAAVIYALLCSGFFGFIMSIVGHFWGMDAAHCHGVNEAFLRGAKFDPIGYGGLFLYAYLCPPPPSSPASRRSTSATTSSSNAPGESPNSRSKKSSSSSPSSP